MNAGAEVDARKAAARVEMLVKLAALAPEERAGRSQAIRDAITASAAWQSAQNVVLFSPMRSEPAIEAISATPDGGEKHLVVIPKTLRGDTDFALPFKPDLILVPGLAFARNGHRLGRGGGFYDRFLARHSGEATKMGVCFAFQVLDMIPTATHDVVMNLVVSD